MKKLITLEKSNQESFEKSRVLSDNSPQPNGIECPNCKEELLDSNPMMTLTSNPPQKNTHCEKCGYKGYRFC